MSKAELAMVERAAALATIQMVTSARISVGSFLVCVETERFAQWRLSIFHLSYDSNGVRVLRHKCVPGKDCVETNGRRKTSDKVKRVERAEQHS